MASCYCTPMPTTWLPSSSRSAARSIASRAAALPSAASSGPRIIATGHRRAMTKPAPLTAAEHSRLWRWQRRMFVFYGVAIALLALAGALMLLFGELAWVRRAALALLLALIAAATLVQFRE